MAKRNVWEELIEAKYLNNMVRQYDSNQDLYKRWGGSAEDGKFASELKEAVNVQEFPKKKRETEMPQLWAFRSAVTLDALHARLGVERNSTEHWPVLCTILQQPLCKVLRALECLVGIFEWHSLVVMHYSGRITRSEAGNITVREVLASLAPSERQRWERAYMKLEQAWHIAWPFVERHECLQLSDNLKQVMITRDSSMLWVIADSTNEGICPLALTQWLVERHNELVQVVSASIGYPPRKVSSRLLGQHDVVAYDEDTLMRFLRSRCVTYGVAGKLNFDFKQLEQHLRREMSRPEITMEVRGFQWLGESFSTTNELKLVIKQRELTPDIIDRIKVELSSPALANLCLQKVQMSVSFILKSGGGLSVEHAGEMLLSEYLRSVLSESPEGLPSSVARAEVHLWHVDAFSKLLRQLINKDPMDTVDPKYKAELPQDLKDRLLDAKPRIPAEAVRILGDFAESRLTETWIGDTVPLIAALQEADDMDVGVETFKAILDNLPAGLEMKHWAAVYAVLKE